MDPQQDAGLTDLTLKQSRFGTRTEFRFGPDALRYRLADGDSDRTWSLEYAELATDYESLQDRRTWWRNLGMVWAVLGAALMLWRGTESGDWQLSIWLPLGLACLVVYRLRRVRYTIVPAQRCNVLVIDDAQGPAILAELERRRALQLRERFDFISPEESPEQQRHRVLWLQKQGSLDQDEVSARLLQIDLLAQADAQRRRDAD